MNEWTLRVDAIDTLKVMLDSLEEGVLFLDEKRRVVEINAAAARLLGKDGHQAIETLCPTLFTDTQCGHECDERGYCSLAREHGETRKVQDIALRRDDGSEVALRMWAMLLPANDAGLHCSIILRDRSREVALEAEVRERWRLGGLVGRSPPMQALYAQILRAAASDASVLITGESGVGKELVARALHDNSPRARGPFVPLDCGALPENLLESELFGHARGAFSGAAAARVGRFEAAGGGTLMLDEIGEISAPMQTKLLRVLQEREVVRLGENHPRKVDVRVVAATHRDLAAMVRRGEFREDLYYRLRVLPLHVVPLRERGDDIALLAGRMLGQLAERHGGAPLRIASEAMAALETCPWPGNVRQLFNALEFAAVHADGPIILRRHLPPEVLESDRPAREPPPEPSEPSPPCALSEPLTRYYRPAAAPDEESALIRRTLAETGGNRAEAARRLGMSRTTLWKRLRQPIR
ncbi:MAG: sigma 54-interacting transcriptional regulator [Burkholderiales bacterium]|nr:sigma 54-interacting transcriptional regulator [Burkholderiales bacterium]